MNKNSLLRIDTGFAKRKAHARSKSSIRVRGSNRGADDWLSDTD
jgi:hypothetical protein